MSARVAVNSWGAWVGYCPECNVTASGNPSRMHLWADVHNSDYHRDPHQPVQEPSVNISDEAVEEAAPNLLAQGWDEGEQNPAPCPVAYDHTDHLDECAVCGWGKPVEKAPASGPKDMTHMTGPQRIQEAIDRLSGAYAPTRRILFRCED